MTEKKFGKFRAFLDSYQGKTLFNYFYGFGASIAILGTLFKILHLDGANVMLAVGLGTEVLMFAISAFEPPFRAYHWEEVFPILKSHKSEDRPTFSGGTGGGVVLSGPMPQGATGEVLMGQPVADSRPASGGAHESFSDGSIDAAVVAAQAAQAAAAAAAAANAASAAHAVPTANAAAGVVGADVTATGGASDMAAGWPTNAPAQPFAGTPASFPSFSSLPQDYGFPPQVRLTEEETASLEKSLKGYVEQMDNLNLNLRGLNTIYEIQLKSISSQIDTIDRVNKGLIHIKDMYEGSATDSESFKTETELMASNLASLNRIYSRMIQAMMMPTPFMAMNRTAQTMEDASSSMEDTSSSMGDASSSQTSNAQ